MNYIISDTHHILDKTLANDMSTFIKILDYVSMHNLLYKPSIQLFDPSKFPIHKAACVISRHLTILQLC